MDFISFLQLIPVALRIAFIKSPILHYNRWTSFRNLGHCLVLSFSEVVGKVSLGNLQYNYKPSS
jgi:hypothetical protein